MRVLVGLAIASVALAGGCRQSDETVKAELRTQMMQRCTTDTAAQAAAVPGFDAQKFCTCVTDKAIGNRSVAELKKLFEDKTGTAAQGRKAGAECLSEQLPASAVADASPSPAAEAVPPPQEATAARNAAAPARKAPPPPRPRPQPVENEAEQEPADPSEDEAVEDSQ